MIFLISSTARELNLTGDAFVGAAISAIVPVPDSLCRSRVNVCRKVRCALEVIQRRLTPTVPVSLVCEHWFKDGLDEPTGSSFEAERLGGKNYL